MLEFPRTIFARDRTTQGPHPLGKVAERLVGAWRMFLTLAGAATGAFLV